MASETLHRLLLPRLAGVCKVLARSNFKAGWWFLDQSIFVIISDHIKENLIKKGWWSPSFAALARTLVCWDNSFKKFVFML